MWLRGRRRRRSPWRPWRNPLSFFGLRIWSLHQQALLTTAALPMAGDGLYGLILFGAFVFLERQHLRRSARPTGSACGLTRVLAFAWRAHRAPRGRMHAAALHRWPETRTFWRAGSEIGPKLGVSDERRFARATSSGHGPPRAARPGRAAGRKDFLERGPFSGRGGGVQSLQLIIWPPLTVLREPPRRGARLHGVHGLSNGDPDRPGREPEGFIAGFHWMAGTSPPQVLLEHVGLARGAPSGRLQRPMESRPGWRRCRPRGGAS